jgi:hypothetical protein
MFMLLLLLCGGLFAGLIFIAGRAFSQSLAAQTVGQSFLMAAGGAQRGRGQRRSKG